MMPTIGDKFYLVETEDKQDRYVIGGRKNIFYKTIVGSEDVIKEDDGWKIIYDHGQDYGAKNPEEKIKGKKKLKKIVKRSEGGSYVGRSYVVRGHM